LSAAPRGVGLLCAVTGRIAIISPGTVRELNRNAGGARRGLP
jgi:hypothetical protein